MAEKNSLSIIGGSKKEMNLVKIKVLETRDVLYGKDIIRINNGEIIEVSPALKERLITCGSALAI